MHGSIHEQQWEVRMACYDRLLRSVMEVIEGAMKTMKVDGMSEAVEDLGKALLAIEDAWAMVSWTLTAWQATSAIDGHDSEVDGYPAAIRPDDTPHVMAKTAYEQRIACPFSHRGCTSRGGVRQDLILRTATERRCLPLPGAHRTAHRGRGA
jgi:hypothetical protein